MRRKIAVFACGWGGEYLQEVLLNVIKSAKKRDVDVFAFINFCVRSTDERINIAEINFLKLPDLREFDGIIVLANSYNTAAEIEYLTDNIRKYNIPTISVEYEIPGIHTIFTDNYAGMYDLAVHMFDEHAAESAMFIGGPKEHQECLERLNALLDAAKERDILIPEENIIYSDWSKLEIGEIINKWYEKNNNFPDVIFCANDVMAIETCKQLNILGLSVPDDVMVTGYDCILEAQRHNPAITSVNHEWNTMGKRAFESVMELIEGREVPHKQILPTKFVERFSCGCHPLFISYDPQKELGRELVGTQLDAIQADSHFRHFYVYAENVDDEMSFNEQFSKLFEKMHIMEGEDFSLCLDPEFFNIVEDNSNLKEHGHCDEYISIVSLKNGKAEPLTKISRRDAIFGKSERSEKAGFYLYLPIYNDTKTYGFAVLNGAINAINDGQNYIWTRHMNQALTQVRSNITIQNLYRKMKELSIKDFLTGTYNRTGCESVAFPIMIDNAKNNISSIIMLIDVDKMKNINDSYGHAAGDNALTTTTKVLRKLLPESYDITRFGGDEFLVTGPEVDLPEGINGFLINIENTLQQTVEEEKIVFPLSFSVGHAKCMPDSKEEIEKAIVLADINMYDMKKLHHLSFENK